MVESQTNPAWETLLGLDGSRPGPLHERLRNALRAATRNGRLGAGSALPPSRRLAADLGCSRWVVTEAYAQLVAEGYLEARPGSATRVRATQGVAVPPATPSPLPAPAPRFDLAPGLPDLRAFPRRRWADAIRAEATTIPFAELGLPPPGGHPRLRGVLAEYLGRARGAAAGAEDVTVCTGVSDGVTRLCRALAGAGIGRLAVEDPGWTRLRQAAAGTGMEVVPVPVDADGLNVADLRRSGARAVIVTPAHQFPTGAVLAPARRTELLAWVRQADGLILEDDYDAEFRYDRRPVGTLQGLTPSRVALLGSVSKTLSPALGIGWIVAPTRWTATLRAEVAAARPPTIDQLAFATFLERGWYDRNLRTARQRYGARRDALVRQLAWRLPGYRISGAAAGLHLLLELPPDVDAAAVVAAARPRGLRLADLGRYHVDSHHTGNGLVLGYGNLADGAVARTVAELTAAVLATSTLAASQTNRAGRVRGQRRSPRK